MKPFLAVEKTDTLKRIYACIIDIVSTVVVGLLLFFFVFNISFDTLPVVKNSKQYIIESEKTETKEVVVNGETVTKYGYDLNLQADLSFDTYLVEAQKFYEYHEEKIVNFFIELALKDENVPESYKSRFSDLQFIFNFHFLGLSMNPVPTEESTYQTSYFIYQFDDSNQEYIWWEYAVPRNLELNIRGESTRQLEVYTSYENLKVLWSRIDTNYSKSAGEIDFYISLSALCSTFIAILIFYIIIPLCLKDYATIGKKVFGYGYVSHKTYKRNVWWRCLLKTIIASIPFLLGMYIFNIYALIFLLIAPYFGNLLVFILSKNDQDILDKIFRIELINIKKSLFFESEEAEKQFLKDEYEENMTDEEKKYTEALTRLSTLNLKSIEEKISDEEQSKDKKQSNRRK